MEGTGAHQNACGAKDSTERVKSFGPWWTVTPSAHRDGTISSIPIWSSFLSGLSDSHPGTTTEQRVAVPPAALPNLGILSEPGVSAQPASQLSRPLRGLLGRVMGPGLRPWE